MRREDASFIYADATIRSCVGKCRDAYIGRPGKNSPTGNWKFYPQEAGARCLQCAAESGYASEMVQAGPFHQDVEAAVPASVCALK